MGGLPCIIKLIQGTQGVGVMIASTMAEVQGMLDTLWTSARRSCCRSWWPSRGGATCGRW